MSYTSSPPSFIYKLFRFYAVHVDGAGAPASFRVEEIACVSLSVTVCFSRPGW